MFENIFESNKEIDRLAVQNRLLKEYEEPVCRRLLEGRQGVRVLDVPGIPLRKSIRLIPDSSSQPRISRMDLRSGIPASLMARMA